MSRPARWSSGPALALVAACAAPAPDDGFADVERLASHGIEQRLHWRRGAEEDERIEAEVDALLAVPLSADSAVQVALLENRSIQAVYEELGIARADLAQAGLLRNPLLVGHARFPDGSPSGTNLELSLVEDLLDVLLRPSRRRIAETRYAETKASVAGAVLALAAEVRIAYYEALGAEQVAAMRELVVEAAEVSAELARRLHEAGNASDLQLARELDLYESARVAWARAEAERLDARERLTRALGLWGRRAGWTLPSRLHEVPAESPVLEGLEALAVERRLDLAAARSRAEAAAQALGVTRDWRLLGTLEVGASAEREPDGGWVVGPELSLELPVFDRRDAAVARQVAELRRADHEVVALAVEIRSEVRSARDRLVAARRLAEHHRDVVIPLRETVVALAQEEHDAMLIGAFELIAAKQAEYDAYQEYVEQVRDYWIARSELELAVGAKLTTAGEEEQATGPEEGDRDEEHEGHGGD